ncbi:MAG: RsmD family RNA methyltransferase [Chloroflexota bacterium]
MRDRSHHIQQIVPPHRRTPATQRDGSRQDRALHGPSFLVWLWGTDHAMALAEVEAVTRRPATLLGRGLVAAAVPEGDADSLRRLGFGKVVLRCLGWSDTHRAPFDPTSVITGSCAVRVHVLADRSATSAVTGGVTGHALQLLIADELWDQLPAPRVDLVAPDVAIHVFATARGLWWGIPYFTIDGAAFTARRPTSRPFWRSIAMAPRKARCLVNLSCVRPGGLLLDPFCGTGSIPIEAALLGVRAFASDSDRAVVAGAARNFAQLGLQHHVRLCQADALSWAGCTERFDAIVSDLPYGVTAAIRGIDREDLYRTFLGVAAGILRPGGRAVLMTPEGTLPVPPLSLRVLGRFLEFVHGSLTREVVVLERTQLEARLTGDRPVT